MAFATFHYATGMVCSGVAGLAVSTGLYLAGLALPHRPGSWGAGLARWGARGFRFLPLLMTAGGFWAMTPDMPRLWREDFPSLPFASQLGAVTFEKWLHRNGDLFFFHHYLDTHREEHQYALHGMGIMIALYTLSVVYLFYLEHRARHNEANRFWQSHKPYLDRVQQAKSDPPSPPV